MDNNEGKDKDLRWWRVLWNGVLSGCKRKNKLLMDIWKQCFRIVILYIIKANAANW